MYCTILHIHPESMGLNIKNEELDIGFICIFFRTCLLHHLAASFYYWATFDPRIEHLLGLVNDVVKCNFNNFCICWFDFFWLSKWFFYWFDLFCFWKLFFYHIPSHRSVGYSNIWINSGTRCQAGWRHRWFVWLQNKYTQLTRCLKESIMLYVTIQYVYCYSFVSLFKFIVSSFST